VLLPIDPEEIHDTQHLEALLKETGFTAAYYAKVKTRLENVRAEVAVMQAHHDAAVKKAQDAAVAKKAEIAARHKPKPRGRVDGRSFKHAGMNAGTAMAAGAALKQAASAYSAVKESGLAADAWTAFTRLDLTEAEKVYIVAGLVLVFLATLGYKATKHY